ncbi:GTPase, partial [Moorena sp. SIO3I8]
MALPIVAVIGRPNVGKSTLVNRLAGVTDAIVHNQPGVTRDRTYRPAFWQDRDYLVVDTGGLVFDDNTEFLPLIREQAMAALAEASAAVLVVDGQAGPTAGDEAIAQWLRQQHVPVVLAVNKCESPQQGIILASQFWELNLGEPFPVSAIHGNGTGE